MNLANEISALETELQSLRSENDILKQHKAVTEFENESLRRALAKANADRDALMRRADAIKGLLDQTGAALMHGLKKIHDTEAQIDDATRAADGADMRFLAKGNGHANGATET